MYSNLKNVQILIALMKKHDIHRVVISAGTRHTPFVASIEQDDWFQTYSVVDERSASFFAIGLIELLQEPVAVVCTSGTAAANYVSGANEAFYQHLPLLILTADRNHYYMFQQEEQMIPQEHLYSDVARRVVTLPHVRDGKDAWYCARICNEALLELRHKEAGPVHINFIVENDYPIRQGIVRFEERQLPDIRRIERLGHESSESQWQSRAKKLSSSRVLIVYGQHGRLDQQQQAAIDRFCMHCDCLISIDLLSNFVNDATISTFALMRSIGDDAFKSLLPDIVITVNANTVTEIKNRLAPYKDSFEHWHVSLDGQVSDPFKCLPDIVETSPAYFFDRMAELMPKRVAFPYRDAWKTAAMRIGKEGSLLNEPIEWSEVRAIQRFMNRLPPNAVLHLANSNTIRVANYFPVKPEVDVFCNRGTNGIDGSMSSYLAQSYTTDRPSFLVIGDLSFFYDMNSLWTSYVGANTRILVINNGGGAIFHTYPNTANVPTLDQHIAAAHNTSVKGWCQSQGFDYHSAHSDQELDRGLDALFGNGNTPVVVEAFTDKDGDANAIAVLNRRYRFGDPASSSIRTAALRILPKSVKDQIRKHLK